MARPEKIRLGDMLVQQDLVTSEQLKLALDEQKVSACKLGRVLVDSGYVTEDGISMGLARWEPTSSTSRPSSSSRT